MLTSPPISVAQNRNDAVRKVAAQARAYSEVKRAQSTRIIAVGALGLVISVTLLASGDDGVAGAIGGIVLLFVNALFMYRERRRVSFAVSVQESFDCEIFDLPWNNVLVKRRPSGQMISHFAAKYTGNRARDWYPDTGQLQRPLDVVVCQQTNVGWGAPVHRAWAWTVVAISIAAAALLAVIWYVIGLDTGQGFGVLVAPFLPLAWEAFEVVRHNFESASEKEDALDHMLEDWHQAITGGATITESQCRAFQDLILGIRRHNAQVPDWFDGKLRGRNERAMRTNADDMIEQARRAGLA
jgi:hypothetical protein